MARLKFKVKNGKVGTLKDVGAVVLGTDEALARRVKRKLKGKSGPLSRRSFENIQKVRLSELLDAPGITFEFVYDTNNKKHVVIPFDDVSIPGPRPKTGKEEMIGTIVICGCGD